MATYEVTATATTASAAASLSTWLRRQGYAVSFVLADGTMGTSDVLLATVSGGVGLRAFALVAREWVKAHKTKLTLELQGRGKLVVEGTTDIERLVSVPKPPAQMTPMNNLAVPGAPLYRLFCATWSTFAGESGLSPLPQTASSAEALDKALQDIGALSDQSVLTHDRDGSESFSELESFLAQGAGTQSSILPLTVLSPAARISSSA